MQHNRLMSDSSQLKSGWEHQFYEYGVVHGQETGSIPVESTVYGLLSGTGDITVNGFDPHRLHQIYGGV